MSRPTQYVPIALCLRRSLRQYVLTPPPPLSRCHAGKHHLRGFKIATQKSARCSASSLGQTPPPLGKKLDPPLYPVQRHVPTTVNNGSPPPRNFHSTGVRIE